MKSMRAPAVVYPGDIWNQQHSTYVNLIDTAYSQSNGTEADFKAKADALQKQRGQRLIDIAIDRTKSSGGVWNDTDYAGNLKSVYHEYFDLHTLLI